MKSNAKKSILDDGTENAFDRINTLWQANLAKMTLGVSPAGVSDAVHAWGSHLAQAPGKMLELGLHPFLYAARRAGCAAAGEAVAECEQDPRFKSENWNLWPWRIYRDNFLQAEDWWRQATTNVPGLDNHSADVVSFGARQMMDAVCPANFPATNPDLAFKTLKSGGTNLINGAGNALADLQHAARGLPPDNGNFAVGKNLAVTPGEVVFRNDLIELIRYTPQTQKAYKEPILIIPAWIMKYYILDLSPNNSLVRWLVSKGHTVYMISWKNPGREDSQKGMDDYYRQGAMAAIDAVSAAAPQTRIHLTGYCLGGTLALITAAALARTGDERLKSLTIFAAQGDFSDAGEVMLFISPSEVSFLKNMMKMQGYLDTKQMSGAFQMLRSYDLIWSKIISDYFEGQRRGMIDLMVWNADATRMPYKMHSEYLEKLFLHNDLSAGEFTVEGNPVATENIHIPVFAVSTEKDHVAPWRSVYKINLMTDTDVTFVLTSGGHNAGIISEPGHKGRSYRVDERKRGKPYIDPDGWRAKAPQKEGSWWLEWHSWLVHHSAREMVAPPPMEKSLCAAPGTYVMQK